MLNVKYISQQSEQNGATSGKVRGVLCVHSLVRALVFYHEKSRETSCFICNIFVILRVRIRRICKRSSGSGSYLIGSLSMTFQEDTKHAGVLRESDRQQVHFLYVQRQPPTLCLVPGALFSISKPSCICALP